MSHFPRVVTNDRSWDSVLMKPIVQSKVRFVLEFHRIGSHKVKLRCKDLTIFIASK